MRRAPAATRAASRSAPTARAATSSARRRATSIVADLVGNTVLQRVRSAELPTAGSVDETSGAARSTSSPRARSGPIAAGAAAASCHPDGRTDTVTWSFEAGPRQTISLDGTFSGTDPEDQRALNWSPVRDENQDFELNTRGIFGGRGFITVDTDLNGDGITPDSDPERAQLRSGQLRPRAAAGGPHRVHPARHPQRRSRRPASGGNATRGRDIFGSAAPDGANCVACHSGGKWTMSRITYDPPR